MKNIGSFSTSSNPPLQTPSPALIFLLVCCLSHQNMNPIFSSICYTLFFHSPSSLSLQKGEIPTHTHLSFENIYSQNRKAKCKELETHNLRKNTCQCTNADKPDMYKKLKIAPCGVGLGEKPPSSANQISNSSLWGGAGGKTTFICKSNQQMFIAAAAKSLQSCPTLCDPMDRSPPGSPVPGISLSTP